MVYVVFVIVREVLVILHLFLNFFSVVCLSARLGLGFEIENREAYVGLVCCRFRILMML